MKSNSKTPSISDLYLRQQIKLENNISSIILPFSKQYHLQYLKEEIHEKIINKFLNNKIDNILTDNSLIIFGSRFTGKKHLLQSICLEYNITLINSNYIKDTIEVRKLFKNIEQVEPSILMIEEYETLKERIEILFEIKLQINKLNEKINSKIMIIAITNEIENCSEFQRSFFSEEFELKKLKKNQKEDLFKYLIEYFKLKTKEINNLIINLIKKIIDQTPGLNIKEYILLFKKSINENGNNLENVLKNILNSLKIKNSLTFDNIGALENIKNELKYTILYPSLYPQIYKKFGINTPSSILLYGPPGCGKTLLAKAISNTLHCNFISIKGPELINKYVGDSEKHLRDIFKNAKLQGPTIIFFDEIDSICTHRSNNEDNSSGLGNRVVNQMLTLMDGVEDRGKVFIIGATNRLNSIDTALLRPGRFDKILKVDYPTKNERYDIFLKCIKYKIDKRFDFNKIDTEYWSGADISGFVKEAALIEIKTRFSKLINPINLNIEKEFENIEVSLNSFLKAKELKEGNYNHKNKINKQNSIL